MNCIKNQNESQCVNCRKFINLPGGLLISNMFDGGRGLNREGGVIREGAWAYVKQVTLVRNISKACERIRRVSLH